MQTIDVTSRWREDWQSATVVNSTLVVDPTIRLPSFDLHRCQWSLLNHFRTGQGHCNACHKKWGFTDNELCDCGEIQTMSHIVNSCTLTKFDGGLLRLHEADEAAVDWLTTYGYSHTIIIIITTPCDGWTCPTVSYDIYIKKLLEIQSFPVSVYDTDHYQKLVSYFLMQSYTPKQF